MVGFLRSESGQKKGCLLLLIAFTIYLIVLTWPLVFAIQFSLLILICFFLRLGWWFPFTIAGTYIGLGDPFCYGFVEGWAFGVILTTLIGFGIGIAIDCNNPEPNKPITNKESEPEKNSHSTLA